MLLANVPKWQMCQKCNNKTTSCTPLVHIPKSKEDLRVKMIIFSYKTLMQGLRVEDKTKFEDIENILETGATEIPTHLGRDVSSFYKTYRKLKNFNFYELLIYGMFIKKTIDNSNLTLKDIVKQIKVLKDIKKCSKRQK